MIYIYNWVHQPPAHTNQQTDIIIRLLRTCVNKYNKQLLNQIDVLIENK